MKEDFTIPGLYATDERAIAAVHESGHAVIASLHGIGVLYLTASAGKPHVAFMPPTVDALLEEEWFARSRASLGGPLAEAAFVRGSLSSASWRYASEADIDIAFSCVDLLHESDPEGATAELRRAISETENLLQREDVWAAVSDLALQLDLHRTLIDSDVRAVLRGVHL